MSTTYTNSRQSFSIGIASALTASALTYWLALHTNRSEELRLLQAKNEELQAQLETLQSQLDGSEQNNITFRSESSRIDVPVSYKNNQSSPVNVFNEVRGSGSIQILKDLESDPAIDSRSSSTKLQDLLSGNPDKEKIAVASRFIFYKAKYPQDLPDDVLQSLFVNQSDPDLRRVIAQVMSQRGNNTYLITQITGLRTQLSSNQAVDRQQALSELAKTHHVNAAEAIAPMLQDSDTNVKLAALFALRDTGNQKHVALANILTNDPDPSVSALASDVAASLRNLSVSAHTAFSRADIESELPPLTNP